MEELEELGQADKMEAEVVAEPMGLEEGVEELMVIAIVEVQQVMHLAQQEVVGVLYLEEMGEGEEVQQDIMEVVAEAQHIELLAAEAEEELLIHYL
ncbi:hypothetical protein HYX09_00025 [Candidatus Woesearchaeota archaeon]|nr:hypothetical protein [Candidatus Woesearchaeota archaeon]